MTKIMRFFLSESLRWYLYSVFHRVVNGRFSQEEVTENVVVNEHYIWIFCSTIGELNACKLLVEHYCNLSKVLLLTDREIYLDSFKIQFPMAEVAVADSDFRKTEQLITQYPAQLAIVCEIPILIHDASCRLSYGVLRMLKQHKVRIVLINGWLYNYKPACKQDSIEKWLFEQDYINCFDLLSVQTEDIKQSILAKGGQPEKVIVTGNMKYDNLDATLVVTEHTQALLDVFKQHSPLFVAGCVTDVWEYQLVVSAFVTARLSIPSLKLIIAPRHPEKPEQLQALAGILQQNNLQFDFRSKIKASFIQPKNVIILDTFGELKAFYSVANVCYVGINHNILEPLSLNKPVAVLENWEKTYPSYPVFKIAAKAEMITVLKEKSELSEFLINATVNNNKRDLNKILKQLSGAFKHNIKLINDVGN